jgi:hypothetical protein
MSRSAVFSLRRIRRQGIHPRSFRFRHFRHGRSSLRGPVTILSPGRNRLSRPAKEGRPRGGLPPENRAIGPSQLDERLRRDAQPMATVGETSMIHTQGLHSRLRPALPSCHDVDAPAHSSSGLRTPLLIQVPAVRPVTRRARRPSASATARVRASSLPYARIQPRRRLRREVRVAGSALLVVVTLALAAILLGRAPGKPVAREDSGRAPIATALRPPTVSISIEPTFQVPVALPEPEPPVVLPGYLLPDDGVEEPGHAGG